MFGFLTAPFFHCIVQNSNGTFSGQSSLEPYIKNHPAQTRGSVRVCPDLGNYYSGGNSFGQFLCTYTMNVFLNPPHQYDPDPDTCYTPPSQQGAPGTPPSVGWNSNYSNESNLDYNNYPPTGFPLSAISEPANTNPRQYSPEYIQQRTARERPMPMNTQTEK